jgi:hypothetical protein
MRVHQGRINEPKDGGFTPCPNAQGGLRHGGVRARACGDEEQGLHGEATTHERTRSCRQRGVHGGALKVPPFPPARVCTSASRAAKATAAQ